MGKMNELFRAYEEEDPVVRAEEVALCFEEAHARGVGRTKVTPGMPER